MSKAFLGTFGKYMEMGTVGNLYSFAHAGYGGNKKREIIHAVQRACQESFSCGSFEKYVNMYVRESISDTVANGSWYLRPSRIRIISEKLLGGILHVRNYIHPLPLFHRVKLQHASKCLKNLLLLVGTCDFIFVIFHHVLVPQSLT